MEAFCIGKPHRLQRVVITGQQYLRSKDGPGQSSSSPSRVVVVHIISSFYDDILQASLVEKISIDLWPMSGKAGDPQAWTWDNIFRSRDTSCAHTMEHTTSAIEPQSYLCGGGIFPLVESEAVRPLFWMGDSLPKACIMKMALKNTSEFTFRYLHDVRRGRLKSL